MRIKSTVENVGWIFLNIADQSYLVKIVLIRHNKCSEADIAHTILITPKPSDVLEHIELIQTNRCLNGIIL